MEPRLAPGNDPRRPLIPAASRWQAQTATDSAAALHQRPFPDAATPELWRLIPDRRAIVLGSRQSTDAIRPEVRAAEDLLIAERRSGGGAVVVDPIATLWIDVFIPQDGPLWTSDLGETFLAVGRRWQHALAGLGLATEMWCQRPDPTTTDLGAVACFAGVGWGELLIDGRKIVGLSQRRTRWGARVQCLYDPTGLQRVLVDALDVASADRTALAEIFVPTLTGLPPIDAAWTAFGAAFAAMDH